MPLTLPSSLFVTHRLSQVGENEFRLSKSLRDALQRGAQTPLPAALTAAQSSPLQDLPRLVEHLDSILHHFLRLDHAVAMIEDMAKAVSERVRSNSDGYLAATLLVPHRDYTARHALHCAIMAVRMSDAQQLDHDASLRLVEAALTMNLGAVDLHNELALQDGPLSTLQRQTLQIHPLTGSAILREAGMRDEHWHQWILLHHEQRDGRGYPFAMRDDAIPPVAHLLHIIDTMAAKLMPRVYRPRLPAPKALGLMYTSMQEPVDRVLAGQLIKIMGLYPPGSFVELKNGERALVVRVGANAAAPLVSRELSPHPLVETSAPPFQIARAISQILDPPTAAQFDTYWRHAPDVPR